MRSLAAALLLALCLVASAQEAVVLKRTGKVGDTWKFRMEATTTLDNKEAKFTSLLTETVKKVDEAKGELTIESVSSQNEVKFNGTTSAPAANTTSTVITSTGSISAIDTGADDPNLYRLAQLNTIQYPTTALKIGDTWTVQIPADERGVVAATGNYKIEAVEKVGEVDTWRVTGTLKETTGENPASMEGTYWIDPKNGSIVKMTGSMTNAPFPSLPLLSVKITLTREK